MKEWKKKRESELENALIAIPVPNIATPLTKDMSCHRKQIWHFSSAYRHFILPTRFYS